MWTQTINNFPFQPPSCTSSPLPALTTMPIEHLLPRYTNDHLQHLSLKLHGSYMVHLNQCLDVEHIHTHTASSSWSLSRSVYIRTCLNPHPTTHWHILPWHNQQLNCHKHRNTYRLSFSVETGMFEYFILP